MIVISDSARGCVFTVFSPVKCSAFASRSVAELDTMVRTTPVYMHQVSLLKIYRNTPNPKLQPHLSRIIPQAHMSMTLNSLACLAPQPSIYTYAPPPKRQTCHEPTPHNIKDPNSKVHAQKMPILPQPSSRGLMTI